MTRERSMAEFQRLQKACEEERLRNKRGEKPGSIKALLELHTFVQSLADRVVFKDPAIL